MTGPVLPLKSYASSAAHLATRTVDSALYEAIVAKAINKLTWARGIRRALMKGVLMLSDANMILKEFIAER